MPNRTETEAEAAAMTVAEVREEIERLNHLAEETTQAMFALVDKFAATRLRLQLMNKRLNNGTQ